MTTPGQQPIAAPRAPLAGPVELRFDLFSGFVEAYSANISRLGMFIATDSPRAVGDRFHFAIGLEDGSDLASGEAEVVWAREPADAGDSPSGMGVRFLSLDPHGRDLIDRVVAIWQEEGGEPFELTGEDLDRRTPARPWTAPVAPGTAATLLEPIPPAQLAGTLPTQPAWIDVPIVEPVLMPSTAAVATTADREEPVASVPKSPSDAAAAEFAVTASRPRRSLALRWLATLGLLAVVGAISGGYLSGRLVGWVGDPMGFVRPETQSDSPERLPIPQPVPPLPPANVAEAAPNVADPDPGVGIDPTSPVAAPTLTRVEQLSWSEEPDGVTVILRTDGRAAPGSWSHSRLDGSPPRVLLRLAGVTGPVTEPVLRAGSGGLFRVRTGFHPELGSGELHVVVDLTEPDLRLVEVEPLTDRLLLRFRRE